MPQESAYINIKIRQTIIKMASEQILTFFNGIKMPAIGYGTWRVSQTNYKLTIMRFENDVLMFGIIIIGICFYQNPFLLGIFV